MILILCSVWYQEIDNVVAIAASPDGKFVYVSNSNGCLYCIGTSHLDIVAQWKPEDAATAAGSANHEPAILASLIATGFADRVYLITATDSSGFWSCTHTLVIAMLFCL